LPRLPQVNARETIAALLKAGFEVDRQAGGHVYLVDPERRRSTVVAEHGGRDVPVGTLHGILKQAGLTVEEFVALLK
jgi:predicted RNA binding protein YcfA (HicA-like mRNA interferase family)